MQYGRYIARQQLGRGGMAEVYLAEDPVLNRLVAVKLILPHLTASTAMQERFAVEARTAATLKNSHIIEVYDYGIKNGRQFFVMEFVHGYSLAEICSRTTDRRLPQDVCVSIICQAAEGLAAAEKLHIVHRDLKSENLMLSCDGVIKIADFGIASTQEDSGLTQAGTIIGTPAYMAPEQFNGLPVTHQTDMWALGVNLYVFLTGRLPFKGKEITRIMHGVCLEKPESILVSAPGTDPELVRLTELLLNKNPKLRGKGAAWLTDLLRKYLGKKNIFNPVAQTRNFIEDWIGTHPEVPGGTDLTNGTAHLKTGSGPASKSGVAPVTGIPGLSSLLPGRGWMSALLNLPRKMLKGPRGNRAPSGGAKKNQIIRITLQPSELTITAGQSKQLAYTMEPGNAEGPLKWRSSNPNVAVVHQASVFALRPGSCDIVAFSADRPSRKAACRVTVVLKSQEQGSAGGR